jgi:hypothetical protein
VTLAGPLEVIQRLNAAWRGNQIDALPRYFHAKALIVDQGHQPLAGSDCLVLDRTPEGWVVVWRQLVWRAA